MDCSHITTSPATTTQTSVAFCWSAEFSLGKQTKLGKITFIWKWTNLTAISFRSHSEMTSRMVWLCLPLLLAVLSPCLVEAAWEDWNTGYGGVKWLFNCDFPGYDIGNQPSSGEDCGRICMDNKSCNHFSHKDGICYMKNVPIHVNRSPANGVVCGFRTCHDLYDIFSGHYCYNKG